MAVGQGFEPREPFGSTVFKTAAFDHSASPPEKSETVLFSEVAHYTDLTRIGKGVRSVFLFNLRFFLHEGHFLHVDVVAD